MPSLYDAERTRRVDDPIPPRPAPARRRSAGVLALQRSAGNQAVARALAEHGERRQRAPVRRGVAAPTEREAGTDAQTKRALSAVAALRLSPAPAGVLALKSTLAVTPRQVNAPTPIAALSAALRPFFAAASMLELYSFHGLGRFVTPATYPGNWQRAGSATGTIDPASRSKSDSKNRDNTVIGPYGHFGAMERSIFGRQNLGNTYDGGHLVEHTLMEGQDADAHGNLAPQENVHFNQGLMRGWEAIPETLMHASAFLYEVVVSYSGDSYTRTGKQLLDAAVVPASLVGALPKAGLYTQANLESLTITFPRWVPVAWSTKVSGLSGAHLPTVTIGSKPEQFRNLKASQHDAINQVITALDPLQPTRTRRNSGTLSGFITGLAAQFGGKTYVLASAPTYTAFMYQPDPMDALEQPQATSTPGGSVPVVLPVATAPTTLLASPFSASAFFTEVSTLPTHLKSFDTRAHKESKHYKMLRETPLKPIGAGVAKKQPKRTLLRNKLEGDVVIKAVLGWLRVNNKAPKNKLALMQAIASANGLPIETRGLLLQLQTDVQMGD